MRWIMFVPRPKVLTNVVFLAAIINYDDNWKTGAY